MFIYFHQQLSSLNTFELIGTKNRCSPSLNSSLSISTRWVNYFLKVIQLLTTNYQWRHAHGARGGGPAPPKIFSKDEKLFLY